MDGIKKQERKTEMNMIVAADRSWAIGKENKMLVSIPADLKWFRTVTEGKVVVMGRKTLESLPGGQPLHSRTNIVLTANQNYKATGAVLVHTPEELLEELKKYREEDIYCIGGESLYRMLLPRTETAYVTRIDFAFEADRYFPDLDALPEWKLVHESEEQTYFNLEYRFLRYERI